MIRGKVLWFLLLGSLLAINECQSRAVNISNTWTLPQEGFSVFYRFFRDKISWFEADAVCQFHHANLVTVDNGVQFDAARAFLKELDVTEFVWIGLMRPQNTQHFGWTNSKPLDSTSGYWADPFPAMESPLCAVIDPARDFRWHALRCGGPETAAFLCEMEVPQWAAECTVQAIPSLTIQYMSDSGTVELSRDCGEEGTRHMPCHGREDRNTILNELTCIDDTDINDNSLKQPSDQLVDIHQKSVELIKAVPSDNKEDNNIDGVNVDSAKGESKSTNDRLKLNLDDVMMGDQPISSMEDKVDLKSLPKADKKQKKKADVEEKYLKKITKKKLERDESDELMMGDQPVYDEATVDPKPKEVTSSPTLAISTTLSDTTEAIVSSTTILTTTETRLRRETEISVNESPSTDSTVFATQSSVSTPTTDSPVKITNKVDIKYTPRPRILEGHASTPHHQKETQEVHLSSDHFIPPMLLVRTQFSLSNGHGEHVDGPRKHYEDHEVPTVPSNDAIAKIKTSPLIHFTTAEATTVDVTTEEVTTAGATTTTIISSTTEGPNSQILDVTTTRPIPEYTVTSTDAPAVKQDASTTTVTSTTHTQYDETTKLPPSPIPTEYVVELKKAAESTITLVTEAPRFRQPHAPKHALEFQPKTPSPTTVLAVGTSDPTPSDLTTTSLSKQAIENVVTELMESMNTVTVTTSSPIVDSITEMSVRNNCSSNSDNSSDKPTELSRKEHGTGGSKHHSTAGNVLHSDHNLNDHLTESTENEDPCWTDENVGADLSNSDVDQPYRPNRRRVLIKPETHSYIKKVLG